MTKVGAIGGVEEFVKISDDEFQAIEEENGRITLDENSRKEINSACSEYMNFIRRRENAPSVPEVRKRLKDVKKATDKLVDALAPLSSRSTPADEIGREFLEFALIDKESSEIPKSFDRVYRQALGLRSGVITALKNFERCPNEPGPSTNSGEVRLIRRLAGVADTIELRVGSGSYINSSFEVVPSTFGRFVASVRQHLPKEAQPHSGAALEQACFQALKNRNDTKQ